MRVTTVVSAPFQVNVHVVAEGDRALVVDASSGLDWDAFAPRLADALRGLTVEAIYLTHLHIDHVGGAARLARMTGAPVFMHEDEAGVVERGDARLTGGALFGVPMEACAVRRVREGDIIPLGDRRFEVLLVPGHSPAHTALWEPRSRALFSGDVAFAQGAFGRVDLPGADAGALIASLERLSRLGADALYAGHMENVEGGANEAIQESLDNARILLG